LAWQGFRLGFGSLIEMNELVKTEDGKQLLNDWFTCYKEQQIKDNKNAN
jgi:hypothetical protein